MAINFRFGILLTFSLISFIISLMGSILHEKVDLE